MDQLVSISTGGLQAALPELAKLLAAEYKLQSSVKDGIRYLQSELGSMQGALEKVSELPAEERYFQVKEWASNLRDMSYVIQDTIATYMVRVDAAAGDSGSSTTCCVNVRGILPRTCKARHDIATEIEWIKKEVEEMSRRRRSYNVDNLVRAVEDRPDTRALAQFEDEEKLVGIERSREDIIRKLSPFMSNKEGEATSEQKLKLVSIVGPAGMGKTTLAHVTYEKLQEKFDCTAFVSVSLQPDINNILSEILREVTRNIKDDPVDKEKDTDNKKHKSQRRRDSQNHYENTAKWSHEEIIREIRLVLEKRRYLIVIDDIWNEQAWEIIKCIFLENKLGSKVITTTRNIAIAKLCCPHGEVDGIIHELQPLSDGDSEQLFYDKIFGKEGCPTNLEDASQRILEKCKGWPLAIVTIASLLKAKQTKTEDQWRSVYKSISTGHGSNRGLKTMGSILSLSYRDMPSQLRACLLYLSIFPEDHIIGRDDLIRRWIAENFVDRYESGEEYFNELIQRSMILPIDVDVFGRARACKVHDLVLDFVNSLSAEENFVTILDGKQDFSSQPDHIHRLSLRNRKEEHGIPQATKRLPHVRTLVVSSRAVNSMPSLSFFPLLRVLELEQCTTRNIKSVGSLLHLRYLRLSQYYGYCIELPEAIGSLQLLQTLDLKDARIEELPSTVVQLRQVRVLEISLRRWDKICEERLLQCLRNMEKLEVLYILAPDLSLDLMFQVDWVPSNLQRFTACSRKKTQHIFRRGSVWAVLSPFSTLPRWINSSGCSSLSDLSIMVGKLRQADLDILAGLPKLLSMDLEVVEVEVEATGRRLEVNGHVRTSTGRAPATAFPCLGNFKFASRAVGLVFSSGAMQTLQKLYLCFDLARTKEFYRDLDLGLENLASLKTVKVEMDCRCSRLGEVEDAEDALHTATSLNPPNCPTLDLKRYFQEEMLSDQEEEIPEELRAKKEEDALLSKLPMYGGNGGRFRDIGVAPHRLENVTIRSGDCVDSLAFSYTDQNGQQRTEGPWGGRGGKVSTINLGPTEYLIKVSGTIGSFYEVANCVTSLTFVTNTASYGPFGKGGGFPFDALPVQSNSSIVGFFGRAGGSLDAIGFYVRPL